MKTYLTLALLFLLIGLNPAANAETQQQQKQLQREIRQLSNSLNSQQSKSRNLQDEVTRLEKQLGKISSKRYDTEKAIETAQVKLRQANQKQLRLDAELEAQQAALAQQLQALHTAGEQSHLRLLLRQDKPSDISRTIRYFEYLNASRLERIQKINKTRQEISSLRDKIEQDRQHLQNLTSQLDKQKADISETIQTREVVLGKVKKDIRSKKKRLNKLKSQESELQKVIDRLARKAAAKKAKAEEAKRAKVAKQQAKKQAVAKKSSNQKGISVTTRYTPDKPFSKLRGRLSWPTRGKIIHRYNTRRNEKQRWRGVVIAAKGGSKVKAVARGRVAFSGWMNGYGHLIIIEHDNNYMSLYGYNRAVYKKEGAIVKANETIAAVGNSGGRNQNALYFEIRKGTSPQNPARWCK